MSLRLLLSLLALPSAFALSACGGGDGASSAAEKPASREQAISEIGAVRTSLDQAVAAVKAGDKSRADEVLADGYVEHFEHVEAPLEQVDAELKERLEATLSHGLRDTIRGGASAARLQAAVDGVKADLAKAEQGLR